MGEGGEWGREGSGGGKGVGEGREWGREGSGGGKGTVEGLSNEYVYLEPKSKLRMVYQIISIGFLLGKYPWHFCEVERKAVSQFLWTIVDHGSLISFT